MESNPVHLSKFLSCTDKVLNTSKDATRYAYSMAYFSSKLMVNGLEINDYQFSLNVFNHYIEKIFPYTGSCDQKTNIVANALSLALGHNLSDVSDKVFNILLGKDFDIMSIENDMILFNLACYYSLRNEKEKMLKAIKQGIIYGKKADEYRQDKDFKDYLNDLDFLNALTVNN